MCENIRPTKQEILKWLTETIYHVIHIEHYLEALQLNPLDPERPHDIVGPGNKFEWNSIKYYSLKYRYDAEVKYQHLIEKAILNHRQQYHHHTINSDQFASEDDYLLGGIDINCALLEDRIEHNGPFSHKEIKTIICNEPNLQRKHWMSLALLEMESIGEAKIEPISSLDNIPRNALSQSTHNAISERVKETRIMLKNHGYKL